MITPISQLIQGPRALLALAQESLARATLKLDDVASLIAGYIFAYHIKDWYGSTEGAKVVEEMFWTECPFAQTISEVANGSKHFHIYNRKLVTDPHVASVLVEPAQIGAIGSLPINATPIGGGIDARIWIRTREHADAAESDFWGIQPLGSCVSWWDSTLPP